MANSVPLSFSFGTVQWLQGELPSLATRLHNASSARTSLMQGRRGLHQARADFENHRSLDALWHGTRGIASGFAAAGSCVFAPVDALIGTGRNEHRGGEASYPALHQKLRPSLQAVRSGLDYGLLGIVPEAAAVAGIVVGAPVGFGLASLLGCLSGKYSLTPRALEKGIANGGLIGALVFAAGALLLVELARILSGCAKWLTMQSCATFIGLPVGFALAAGALTGAAANRFVRQAARQPQVYEGTAFSSPAAYRAAISAFRIRQRQYAGRAECTM